MYIPQKVLQSKQIIPSETLSIHQNFAKALFKFINKPKDQTNINNKSQETLISREQLQKDIYQWFFNLDLKSRIKVCSINNKWYIKILHQLSLLYYYENNYNFKIIDDSNEYSYAGDRPNDLELYTCFYKVCEATIIWMGKNKNIIKQIEGDFCSQIRYISLSEFNDTLTLKPAFLLDKEKCLNYFDKLSKGEIFTSQIDVDYDKSTKMYNFSQPEWIKKSQSLSLSKIFLSLFEQMIQLNYQYYYYTKKIYEFPYYLKFTEVFETNEMIKNYLIQENALSVLTSIDINDLLTTIKTDANIAKEINEHGDINNKVFSIKNRKNELAVKILQINLISDIIKQLMDIASESVHNLIEVLTWHDFNVIFQYADIVNREIYRIIYRKYNSKVTLDLLNDETLTVTNSKSKKKKKKNKKKKNNSTDSPVPLEDIKKDSNTLDETTAKRQQEDNPSKYEATGNSNQFNADSTQLDSNTDDINGKEMIMNQKKEIDDIVVQQTDLLSNENEKENNNDNSNINVTDLKKEKRKNSKNKQRFYLYPVSTKKKTKLNETANTDLKTSLTNTLKQKNETKLITEDQTSGRKGLTLNSNVSNMKQDCSDNTLVQSHGLLCKDSISSKTRSDEMNHRPFNNEPNNLNRIQIPNQINDFSNTVTSKETTISQEIVTTMHIDQFIPYYPTISNGYYFNNQMYNYLPNDLFFAMLSYEITSLSSLVERNISLMKDYKNKIKEKVEAIIISALTAKYEIELVYFGSYATELALEDSDIDIAIKYKSKSNNNNIDMIINELIIAFEGNKEMFDYINPIYTANKPIIKLQCDFESDINEKIKKTLKDSYQFDLNGLFKAKFDLTFLETNNLSEICPSQSSVEYVKKSLITFPIIKPINYVLKRFLQSWNLNSSYKGGLSSFSLFLILLSFIKYPLNTTSKNKCLGSSLFNFLDCYGSLSYSRFKIDSTEQNPFGLNDNCDIYNSQKITIIDPITKHNVAKMSFKVEEIKHAFKKGHIYLNNYSNIEMEEASSSSILEGLFKIVKH